MVFVKVRETYDLHTIRDKLTVIGIHTPSAQIIKKNYPGLLMQCRAYRPVRCDIRIACASMMPLDPLGVGTSTGDVAPEDVFNPILYKAMSNFGMSQIDQYVHSSLGVAGDSLDWENTGVTPSNITTRNDFDIYYGLLADTNNWKHASAQSGLTMSGLVPLVYETYQTVGDNSTTGASSPMANLTPSDTLGSGYTAQEFRGKSHPMPMLNCTTLAPVNRAQVTGFDTGGQGHNVQVDVPAPKVFVGCIIVPPSRLHELFYRLVCEWTLEFSQIRNVTEICQWQAVNDLGAQTHHISYNFNAKSLPDSTSMVDTTAGSDIKKVM